LSDQTVLRVVVRCGAIAVTAELLLLSCSSSTSSNISVRDEQIYMQCYFSETPDSGGLQEQHYRREEVVISSIEL